MCWQVNEYRIITLLECEKDKKTKGTISDAQVIIGCNTNEIRVVHPRLNKLNSPQQQNCYWKTITILCEICSSSWSLTVFIWDSFGEFDAETSLLNAPYVCQIKSHIQSHHHTACLEQMWNAPTPSPIPNPIQFNCPAWSETNPLCVLPKIIDTLLSVNNL